MHLYAFELGMVVIDFYDGIIIDSDGKTDRVRPCSGSHVQCPAAHTQERG